MMKRKNVSEAIGVIVALIGAVVMLGWFLNVGILKSILLAWVSMKFITAFSFLLSGILLYFIARFPREDRELAVICIPIMSMVIILFMAALFVSTLIGINAGVEEMFIKDSMIPVRSVTPGRPSVATMINFVFVAMAGILTVLDIKRRGKVLAILGVLIAVIGLTAILGYCINQPLLYFAVSGKSSAMAIHTAILFVFWGFGLIFLERGK